MIHDETTTEIEIPIKKADTNIVRVDFAKQSAQPQAQRTAAPQQAAAAQTVALPSRARRQWFNDLDMGSPWILRLIAVGLIIALSLLIL